MWLYLIIFFIPATYMDRKAENRSKALLVCYMGVLALFIGSAISLRDMTYISMVKCLKV